MRTLGILLILLLVSVVGVGFYRGWGSLSADDTDNKSSATITLDKDQIREDGQTAKAKLQDIGQAAKEAAGEPTGKVEAQQSPPQD